ncbi:MAG: hypothetical protein IPP41_15720 [Rhodocyclaceae bacterium]|nr:hypothetical protein [Rhodocyclaceae bacterium]
MPLEQNRLLGVKLFEITVLGIRLKSGQSLGNRIDRCLTIALSLFQKDEILTFDSFVLGIVRFHGFLILG